ncbi:MAG TPA: hypothetical protein VG096_04055 [Bryobacteraceae bacterium]|jgi:hypothetical protein|nr:hypothetical protein [Bryobacteraceae bacterium]
MAQFARDKISRRSWLLAGLAVSLFRARATENLSVIFDGDTLRVAAPQLHFLSGKPLARLKDANTVVFLSRLTLFSDDHVRVFRQTPERLTISYDIWEEKFKVVLAVEGRSASRLSLTGAEAFCLENLAISTLGLAPNRPFWLRFELREEDPRETASVVGDPGISLTGLIERFARKPGADQAHWTLEAGPLRLADLHRKIARGSDNREPAS